MTLDATRVVLRIAVCTLFALAASQLARPLAVHAQVPDDPVVVSDDAADEPPIEVDVTLADDDEDDSLHELDSAAGEGARQLTRQSDETLVSDDQADEDGETIDGNAESVDVDRQIEQTEAEADVQDNPSEQDAADQPARRSTLTADAEAIAAKREQQPPGPATLKGVALGMKSDLVERRWGKPLRSENANGRMRLTFQLDKLGTVRATFRDDALENMAVLLEKPLAPSAVARQFQLGEIEPVEITDDVGQPLGRAYPERGVLIGYAPKSNPPRVLQVVIEKLSAQQYLARAESRINERYADCLDDLQSALELEPESSRAHAMYGELTRRAGELDAALEAAKHALELDPNDIGHLLTLAKVLADRGDYQPAMRMLRDAIEESETGNDTNLARAYLQWGDCLATMPNPDHATALKHHTKAISLAQPLAKSTKPTVRRAAKDLLAEANLAVAYDIGWGRWQQKASAVPKWIDKAMSYVDDLINNENASESKRVMACAKALVALAGIEEPPDANKWVRVLTEQGAKHLAASTDSTYRAHVAWEMGQALAAAVEIEALRNHAEKSLKLGQTACEYLEQGAVVSRQLPTSDLILGKLYYRLGAVFAMDRDDAQQAVSWYSQAVPLLERPTPPTGTIDLGRHGETFVSMAVSYWEVKYRDEALRLTEQGVALMEQAAEDGKLNRQALAIPYGNLASMHEQMGHTTKAREYAEIAASYDEPARGIKK